MARLTGANNNNRPLLDREDLQRIREKCIKVAGAFFLMQACLILLNKGEAKRVDANSERLIVHALSGVTSLLK
ncbi:MAG: hypothetical protein VW378_05595 [bacterium]